MTALFHRFRLSRAARRRRIFSPTAVPGNINITGVQATGAAGTAIAEVDTGALTGVVGSGAAGTAVAQVSAFATGVFGSGQVGVLTIQQGPVGVQGNGFAGTATASVSAFITGVSGAGAAGTLFGINGVTITGVSGFGFAGDVYPIPPAPRNRPPLLIPQENGLPASLWLGSNG